MTYLSRAFMALTVLLASFGGSVRDAAACSCIRPDNENKMTSEERDAWHLDRAQIVVSGRVTDVHAGEDVKRAGHRAVVAKLNVKSVLKGDAPLGEMTLLTGFGTGDCGLAGALMVAASGNRDLTLEVQKIAELQNEYAVSICGYGKLSAFRAE